MMEHVIITGATGMVGATMIEQMLADGIRVTGIVRPASAKMKNLTPQQNLEIIECDIDNLLSLKETPVSYTHLLCKFSIGKCGD